MKIGVNIKIDVTKLDKARFFKGKKGTYANIITFIDIDNKGEHGDNGFVTQEKNKDEEIQMPILGNAKVFWVGEGQPQQRPQTSSQPNPANHQAPVDDFDEDLPF